MYITKLKKEEEKLSHIPVESICKVMIFHAVLVFTTDAHLSDFSIYVTPHHPTNTNHAYNPLVFSGSMFDLGSKG